MSERLAYQQVVFLGLRIGELSKAGVNRVVDAWIVQAAVESCRIDVGGGDIQSAAVVVGQCEIDFTVSDARNVHLI